MVDPITPFVAPNESVTSVSDRAVTQHSDATDWIRGARQDIQSTDLASRHSVNSPNARSGVQSSYEESTYLALIAEFGLAQANDIAQAFSWNVNFFRL